MKKSYRLFLLSVLLALPLTACVRQAESSNSESEKPSSESQQASESSSAQPSSSVQSESQTASSESQSSTPQPAPVVSNVVPVFLLSGQSNMEGSTYWKHPNGTPLLENYMDQEGLDTDGVLNGIDNVLTSFYGFYHPNGWTQAHSSSLDQSSPEGKMTPNFQPTKVGMGVGDTVQGQKDIFFGPELGLADTLKDVADEDNPIHLIKCAFSGSGFNNGNPSQGNPNWGNTEDDPTKSLYYLFKTYVHNCLDAIEDEGYTPEIKGFLWHQGESGGGIPDYETSMRKLLNDVRTEFEDYAPDGDGENIAFIDCTIYDGKGTSSLNYGTDTNNAKMRIANESEDDLNFIINANHEDGGLALEVGDDSKGGYNTYHYNTKDAYILGKAYADIIIENDLLD